MRSCTSVSDVRFFCSEICIHLRRRHAKLAIRMGESDGTRLYLVSYLQCLCTRGEMFGTFAEPFLHLQFDRPLHSMRLFSSRTIIGRSS